MGTSLTDQDLIPVFQLFQSPGAFRCRLQVSFISGEENRKRSERDLFRRIFGNSFEYLAVGDHQPGLFPQALQGLFYPVFLYDHRHGAGVQDIPDGLLLGKDQPSLWRSLVNRHHQHHKISGGQQVSQKLPLVFPGAAQRRQPLFQLMDPRPLSGAYPEKVSALLIPFRQPCKGLAGLFLCKGISLVQHQDTGDLFLSYPFQEHPVLPAHPGLPVQDQHRHIGLIQYLIAFLYPEAAKLSLIVDARGIHHHHRPQGQQLHRLIHRICSGSLNIRYHRQILTGNLVHHTGFPCVPLSKKTDMHPLSPGRLIHSHVKPPVCIRTGNLCFLSRSQPAVPVRSVWSALWGSL